MIFTMKDGNFLEKRNDFSNEVKNSLKRNLIANPSSLENHWKAK